MFPIQVLAHGRLTTTSGEAALGSAVSLSDNPLNLPSCVDDLTRRQEVVMS